VDEDFTLQEPRHVAERDMIGNASLKLLLLSLLLVVAGFLAFLRRDESTIRRYEVERPAPRDRMLGAIIPRGESAWFFKLSGPDADVTGQAERFRELVRSVRFGPEPSSEPSWTLPDGWRSRPSSQMRFATLEMEGSGGTRLECSVTVLPRTIKSESEYLLANINRWREQIRQPRITIDELSAAVERIPLPGEGLAASLVDLSGELSGSGTAAAPFAGGGMSRGASSAGTGSRAPQPSLKYDVPAGWTKGELEVARGGITVRRAAAFEVVQGSERVEITVTSLPASAVLGNVNRWRGQIGLEGVTGEQFQADKQSIEFAGSAADYVHYVGAKEAILGVIAQRDGMTWFVKLQGSNELAARERERFEQFVRSIRLE
jgi:hypothetical protein